MTHLYLVSQWILTLCFPCQVVSASCYLNVLIFPVHDFFVFLFVLFCFFYPACLVDFSCVFDILFPKFELSPVTFVFFFWNELVNPTQIKTEISSHVL